MSNGGGVFAVRAGLRNSEVGVIKVHTHYRKSSNYSAKNFNSNLQLVLLLEPKNTSKVTSDA